MAKQKALHLANVLNLKNKVLRTDLFNYLKNHRHVNGRTVSQLANDETASISTEQKKNCNIHLEHTGPTFRDFLANVPTDQTNINPVTASETEINPSYIDTLSLHGQNRKVYFDVHGCQMNVNDVEISWSILKNNGYTRTTEATQADIILIMTCSIRDGAEQKIWKKLKFLKSLKIKREKLKRSPPLKIGILGCMAERLKTKILDEEKMVDLVCGPDAYKDLPRLLATTQSGQAAVNVLLSLDETYADVMPVRLNENSPSAFVSIMRGCDNMCSYCIVPFTRGKERSRPIASILEEVKMLSDQGIKEITLLGQNVNSYRDTSDTTYKVGVETNIVPGFKTVYKPKRGGKRFSDLLEKVSDIDPEMRIRFTSPHPKDFPDEVVDLIQEKPNICNQIHLPAQSGNNEVLERMRRGYTREAYLDLVYNIKDKIPDMTLSSDFIAGFCGETEAAHEDTVSLMRMVKYNVAYCFPYSMRQKTNAYHKMKDDVPVEIKKRRHLELASIFREEAEKINHSQRGKIQLVLVEGESRRSSSDMAGRNDGNIKVIVPNVEIPRAYGDMSTQNIKMGDYIVVQILSSSSQVLHGVPLYHTTLTDFYRDDSRYSEQLYNRAVAS